MNIIEWLEKNLNIESIWSLIIEYGVQLAIALAIFFVGKWAAKGVRKVVRNFLGKADMDPTLISFLGNIIYALVLTVVIVAALGQLGVQTASLVAVIGAAGLAVGLALQGSLSNFAAGVMIIAFRPFRAGDFIEAAGISGTVKDVDIFTSTLLTPDNKTIIIPNNEITSSAIINYSKQNRRRIDMVYGIGYDDNIQDAKAIIEKHLNADKRVLKDPAYTVGVLSLGDNSVNIAVRPWVKTEDYWATHFALHEAIKDAFDEADISIPYPQRDVHHYYEDDAPKDKKKPESKAAANRSSAQKTTAKSSAAKRKSASSGNKKKPAAKKSAASKNTAKSKSTPKGKKTATGKKTTKPAGKAKNKSMSSAKI